MAFTFGLVVASPALPHPICSASVATTKLVEWLQRQTLFTETKVFGGCGHGW
jgi:hypothetical protein